MEKKWIQGAIKHPGSFSAAAKRSKMSTAAYAGHVLADPNASEKMKRKARLAKVLMAMHRHHRVSGKE